MPAGNTPWIVIEYGIVKKRMWEVRTVEKQKGYDRDFFDLRYDDFFGIGVWSGERLEVSAFFDSYGFCDADVLSYEEQPVQLEKAA